MNRFFVAERCPDCRSPLPSTVGPACPSCGLALVGPQAQELRLTLQHADRLLATLRPAAGPTSAAEPFLAPATAPDRAPVRMPSASVPAVLLGLGALCLVVAAIVFVAVSWSDLSLAARTTLLAVVTLASAVVAGRTMRSRLVGAAETLTVVTTLLVLIDVLAGRSTGLALLGAVPADRVGWLASGTLLGSGLAWAAAGRLTPVRRLWGVQVLAVLGLWGLASLTVDALPVGVSWGAGLLVLPLTVAGWLARRAGLPVVAVGAVAAAGTGWLVLAVDGLVHAVAQPALGSLLAGSGARLFVAGALAIGCAVVVPARFGWLRVGAAVVGMGAVAALVLLALADSDLKTDVKVLLAAGFAVAVAAVGAVRRRDVWSTASAVLAAGLVLLPLTALLVMLGVGLTRVADGLAGAWTLGPGDSLPAVAGTALGWSLPLVGSGVALAGALAVRDHSLRLVLAAAGGLGVGAVAAVLVSGWPVALVAAVVSSAAVAAMAGSVWRRDAILLVVGAAASALALAVASASRDTSAVVFATHAVLLGAVAMLTRTRRAPAPLAAAGVLAAGASAAAFAEALGAGALGHGLTQVVLAAVAGLAPQAPAVRRTRIGVEAAAVAVALAGLVLLADQESWLAVGLTVTGVASVAVGLVRRGRRAVRWAGVVQLALASWVRLFDLGIETWRRTPCQVRSSCWCSAGCGCAVTGSCRAGRRWRRGLASDCSRRRWSRWSSRRRCGRCWSAWPGLSSWPPASCCGSVHRSYSAPASSRCWPWSTSRRTPMRCRAGCCSVRLVSLCSAVASPGRTACGTPRRC
ncbi:MAG: hypothetical protein GEU96_21465, partial [Propionibacteriales bacterium]|nr:hypothetical protein [Propionibacteriales bacterium]